MTVDRFATGYQPDFDIDYEVGAQAELFVRDIIAALGTERVEIKNDVAARKYRSVYLETECHYPRAGWKATGINGTKAELWCHVLEGSIAIIAPLGLWQEAALRGQRKECIRGDHPTKGVRIPLSQLLPWLIDSAPEW